MTDRMLWIGLYKSNSRTIIERLRQPNQLLYVPLFLWLMACTSTNRVSSQMKFSIAATVASLVAACVVNASPAPYNMHVPVHMCWQGMCLPKGFQCPFGYALEWQSGECYTCCTDIDLWTQREWVRIPKRRILSSLTNLMISIFHNIIHDIRTRACSILRPYGSNSGDSVNALSRLIVHQRLSIVLPVFHALGIIPGTLLDKANFDM